MSSVKGTKPLSSASIFLLPSARLPLPLKIPKGSHLHWSITGRLSNTCPCQDLTTHTKLLGKPAITNKIMCGCAEAMFPPKQTEIKIVTKIVQLIFHINSQEFALVLGKFMVIDALRDEES